MGSLVEADELNLLVCSAAPVSDVSIAGARESDLNLELVP